MRYSLICYIINLRRLRLRLVTPEEPADEEIPPPNMSDKPPPLPLCSRIDMIRKKLDSTRSTWRTILSTVTLWFSLRYRASVSWRALLRGSVCRVCPIRAGLYPIHTGSIMSGSSASSCEADEPGQPPIGFFSGMETVDQPPHGVGPRDP